MYRKNNLKLNCKFRELVSGKEYREKCFLERIEKIEQLVHCSRFGAGIAERSWLVA